MSDKSEAIQAPKNVVKFDKPTLVRRENAVRFLSGDPKAHFVPDLIYGRGERIAGLIFKLAPGEYFRTSDTWRTIYDQDRYYYVVCGELTIQDPETGDVAVAKPGEAVARAHRWFELLVSGTYATMEALAEAERTPASEISRALPLAFLSPQMTEMIVEGNQPDDVALYRIKRNSELLTVWASDQKSNSLLRQYLRARPELVVFRQ